MQIRPIRLRGTRAPVLGRPGQVLVASFAGAVVVGTLLLMLPIAVVSEPPPGPLPSDTGPWGGAPVLAALFTATSAVCVTGLIVVDTATYWSPFGQVVVLALIQLGGLGIMTFASLLTILLARRLGLRSRLIASASVRSVSLGDVRAIVIGVAKVGFGTEAVVAIVLAVRLATGYGAGFGESVWFGVFHSVSAFNNAGFALYSDNLMGFVTDPWVCLPIAAAVVLGGLGFPVIFELRRHFRMPRKWSMHTKLVLSGTVVLLLGGVITITALEWSNPQTLGPLDPAGKVLAGVFASVVARTAGFNSIDISAMHTQTWFAQDVLMFIGGGPAGTAGGLKITTFAVLFFIIVTEIRGGTAVNIFGRRLARSVHREATTVALLAVAVVMIGTWCLLIMSTFSLDQIVFEVVSAFATVGLSTGITHLLPTGGQLILVALMFIGRLGPLTLASALALRSRSSYVELPKERPIIG
ncbi:TrkH family potassium uptake protein [Occultella kanbiaonis]|uniref:TrkH family potassium uptake protein n=1 Tax=Occultella kanbiaonis TaxID=2675754 RepID=UPI0013D77AFE|nr:potassium transporter TrkG [Occultella kanbiaonis]